MLLLYSVQLLLLLSVNGQTNKVKFCLKQACELYQEKGSGKELMNALETLNFNVKNCSYDLLHSNKTDYGEHFVCEGNKKENDIQLEYSGSNFKMVYRGRLDTTRSCEGIMENLPMTIFKFLQASRGLEDGAKIREHAAAPFS